MAKIFNLFIGMCMAAFMTACNDSHDHNGGEETMNGNISPVSETTRQAIKVVKDSRIFFAHKSVGDNILSGLKTLADEAGVKLIIRDVNTETVADDNVFAHSRNGENGDPVSKIDAFYSTIKGFKTFTPQIAFMKFCYVDFGPNTDVNRLLSHYKNTMETLKKERPDILFVHVTAPLTAKLTDWKSRIKRLIDIQKRDDASNIKRNKFNQLLRKTFPQDPIFDIARIESTYPDGRRESFTVDGETYYRMAPDYTTDGGHLNPLGQRRVAAAMVELLAGLLKGEQSVR